MLLSGADLKSTHLRQSFSSGRNTGNSSGTEFSILPVKLSLMKIDPTLQFISKCVTDAGQAMVFRQLDNHSRQPLGFKTGLTVDDKGQLYFTMNTQFEENIADDYFPVEVFIYKKGNPVCVSATGIAERLWVSSGEKNVCVRINSIEVLQDEKKEKGFIKNLLVSTGKFIGLF